MEDDDFEEGANSVSGTITLDGVSLDDDYDDNGYIWYDATNNNGYTYGNSGTVSSMTWTNPIWGLTTSGTSIASTSANITIGDTTLEDDGTFLMRKGDREEDLFEMADRLNLMEELLGIPRRDLKLEAEHPDLKKEFDKHIAKVRKVLNKIPAPDVYNKKREQYKAWEKLKVKQNIEE